MGGGGGGGGLIDATGGDVQSLVSVVTIEPTIEPLDKVSHRLSYVSFVTCVAIPKVQGKDLCAFVLPTRSSVAVRFCGAIRQLKFDGWKGPSGRS